jgi:peptidoglycan/LPS O-acetylase OafA/YrhL
MTSYARDDLPNLDALRSLAVLLVLADHVLETLGGAYGRTFHPYDWYFGRLGVLLFFVHTCYVLMASMERLGNSGWNLARTFYVRRAFRIYPLAMFCILLVVLVGVPVLPWERYSPPGSFDLASNLLLTTNLTASDPVLAPLWSLPLEVQMYLALPLIFLWSSRSTHLPRIAAIYAVALLLAWFVPRYSVRLGGAMFAPCFMAGVVAFALRDRMTPRFAAPYWLLFLAAMVLLYVLIEDATPGIHHVLLQAAICLLVGLAIPLFRQSRLPKFNLVVQLVARYSYGVYLFHCVSLWLAYHAVSIGSAAFRAGLALASLVVLSVVSYHLLEQPAIRLGAYLSRRRTAQPLAA